MEVGEGGRFPPCDACQQANGARVATRHRQVHLRANGRESCVDEHLTGVIVGLWQVCETTGSCQDHDGRAYVVPTPDTLAEGERFLTGLGLVVDNEDGVLFFRLPAPRQDGEPASALPAPEAAAADGDLLPVLHRLEQRIVSLRRLLTGVTAGVTHVRVDGAHRILHAAATALANAMRALATPFVRLPWPTRALGYVPGLVVLALVFWLASLVASALSGGSLAWMVVAALAAYGLVAWPYLRIYRRVIEALTRRHIRRVVADPAWIGPDEAVTSPAAPDRDRMLSLICTELLHIQAGIAEVRSGVARVGRRRRGEHPPHLSESGAGLVRAMAHDEVLNRIVDAELALATAYDGIRLWLSLPRG